MSLCAVFVVVFLSFSFSVFRKGSAVFSRLNAGLSGQALNKCEGCFLKNRGMHHPSSPEEFISFARSTTMSVIQPIFLFGTEKCLSRT